MKADDNKCPMCGSEDLTEINPEETDFLCANCGCIFNEEELKSMSYE